MRITRVLTVLAATAATTAVLAAPASATDAPSPIVYPSYEAASAAVILGPTIAPITAVLVQTAANTIQNVTEAITVTQPADPLAPLRPLLTSEIDVDYLGSIGAVAIDSDILNSIYVSTIPSYSLTHYLDNNSSISSYCTYTRSGFGVASGGIDFTVAAEATAYGRYKGVEIVATGVECKLYKPDMTIGTGAMFAPGSLSVATAQRTSYDARGGYVCVQAWALLRHAPVGESSALKTTGVTCFYV